MCVYADSYNCLCLHLGGPDEYSPYWHIAAQKGIAEAQRGAGGDGTGVVGSVAVPADPRKRFTSPARVKQADVEAEEW